MDTEWNGEQLFAVDAFMGIESNRILSAAIIEAVQNDEVLKSLYKALG